MLTRALTQACLILVPSLLVPSALRGQTMEEVLNSLFVFGGGDQPLTLAGPPDTPHGEHFIPSESETNGAVLQFFNNSIAANIGSFPLSSTVGSQTFVFVGGVPTPTSTSFGPIFAERAQTLGRGRLTAGVNFSRLRFDEVRGVSLDDVQLTFVHDNVAGPELGDVTVENDLLRLSLDLDIEAEVYAFYATFGLTDWLDVGVAVPIIDLELDGTSRAAVEPSTLGDSIALHFFSGTPSNPILSSVVSQRGGATGIGDIAARLKIHVVRGNNWDVGVLGELRAPTGDERDFLGTGDVNAKGLFIASGTLGDFSPHTNIGFEYRGNPIDQNEVEVIAGFDHRLANWATLAVDLLSAFKVGEQEIQFPEEVVFDLPFPTDNRRVRRTNIPDIRDDIIDGSIGFKFRTGAGLVIITNVLVPLNDGGLRSSPIPTLGVEYSL